jgi:hypothetical protein
MVANTGHLEEELWRPEAKTKAAEELTDGVDGPLQGIQTHRDACSLVSTDGSKPHSAASPRWSSC